MKLISRAFVAFIIIFLYCISLSVFADEATLSLESKIVDDFDSGLLDRWVIRGSKFATEGFPKLAEVKAWPENLFGKNREGIDYRCLGIKGSFDRKGYNYIEVIPAKEAPADTPDESLIFVDPSSGKKWVHNPITLKGRTKMIDLWVWGSNYNYYIEVHLEDFQGSVHVLKLGDLLYAGWRNLSVNVPPSIPQAEHYIPSLRKLKLIKFMIWSRPMERSDAFYIYLDYLKTFTDMYESRFDGDEFEDPDFLDEIWGSNSTSSTTEE